MVAQISEYYESREFTVGSGAGRELVYIVINSDDETEIQALLLATSPTTYQGLIRDSVNAVPDGAANVWKGSVRYKGTDWGAADPETPPTLIDFSFDTSGGTQKITQSYDTTIWDAVGREGLAPDFHGAINVDDDKVEGTEILVPKYEFQEVHRFDDAFVTLAYRMIIFNLTGKMNDADFKGFASGEVLFMGATGSKRGTEKWELTFKFGASPNRESLDIGTSIIGIEKLGWDYVWCRYEDVEDAGAYKMVKRPLAAYQERVYEFGNFAELGIGVT